MHIREETAIAVSKLSPSYLSCSSSDNFPPKFKLRPSKKKKSVGFNDDKIWPSVGTGTPLSSSSLYDQSFDKSDVVSRFYVEINRQSYYLVSKKEKKKTAKHSPEFGNFAFTCTETESFD